MIRVEMSEEKVYRLIMSRYAREADRWFSRNRATLESPGSMSQNYRSMSHTAVDLLYKNTEIDYLDVDRLKSKLD